MDVAKVEQAIMAKMEETKPSTFDGLVCEVEIFQELEDGEKFLVREEFGICYLSDKGNNVLHTVTLTLLAHSDDGVLKIQVEPTAHYVVEVISWTGTVKHVEEGGYVDPNYEALDSAAQKEGEKFIMTVVM